MRLLPLLLFTLLCTCVSAQTLTGRITDAETGEPLPFASIYIQETQSGSASNADGFFQVKLKPGGNTVVFQYLGYQTQVKTVSGSRNLDVALVGEALELQQVEILSGGEDKSYSVIRRAIAKADFHRNQLDSYSAEVYIKGTGKVNKVSGLIRMLAGKEAREEIKEVTQRPFTSESTSKVVYTRPNNYEQEVVSKLEVGDSDFDATQYIFTSFYDPLVAGGAISPLNPKAFGYYKFELEGVFVDQDELINKIKVIPRSRGEDVFDGYVYIVQDDWSLHSLDLTTFKLGIQIDIAQNFAEVQEHVWMPVTTTLDAKGQLLGVGFEYHYLSTVSDYVLDLNETLGGYVEVIDEKTQPEAAAQTRKVREVSELEEQLANGGEITRKDLRKLMRNYEKEEQKKSEEPEVVSNYNYKEDSTVTIVTDTAAWAKIRPVPLTEQEKLAYVIADSVERAEEIARVSSASGENSGINANNSRNGYSSRKNPHLKRIILPEPFFNPVEGYALGARFGLRNTKRNYRFSITPRYGFGWDRLTVKGDFQLGESGGRFNESRYRLTGGRFLRQFDDGPAISPWISAFTNLSSGENYIRLYERVFGQFDYRREYSKALRAEFRLAYEDRRAVSNTSNQRWFGGGENVYQDNAPINAQLERVSEVNPAATARLALSWRPGLKYRMVNGDRETIESSSPTLTAELRGGLPNIGNSRSDFALLEAGYQHRFDVGRKGSVDLLVRGGVFLNNNFVDFPDFKHFSTSEILLTSLDPIGSYRLLPYYQESTSEEYLEFYGHYQFRKFLLTQIWSLHLLGLKEDLFVNYLHTPTSDNYVEVGYSIDNIFRFFRLEFVNSFRDLNYHDFGIRLSVTSSAFFSIE